MIRSLLQAPAPLSRSVSRQHGFQIYNRISLHFYKPNLQARSKSVSFRDKGNLSRTDRRKLEREAKKPTHRHQENSKPGSSDKEQPLSNVSSKDSISHRLQKWIPNPRIPGGARSLVHSSHRMHLATRFSLAMFLFLLIQNDSSSPYVMDMTLGPSMLPTFRTVGEVYVRETGAWSRLLGIPIAYEIGDLVVFRDSNGRYVGKRIIGVEGDEVLRYGEYVQQYLDREDWGITKSIIEEIQPFEDENEVVRDPGRKITVPSKHVWLEGDFPPFSRDSRHYGPIPVEWIRGRIVARIWPWNGEPLAKIRPRPLSVTDALAGTYNLHLNPNHLNRGKPQVGGN
jgi:mitochondrial inner membrane protease subunit 1